MYTSPAAQVPAGYSGRILARGRDILFFLRPDLKRVERNLEDETREGRNASVSELELATVGTGWKRDFGPENGGPGRCRRSVETASK